MRLNAQGGPHHLQMGVATLVSSYTLGPQSVVAPSKLSSRCETPETCQRSSYFGGSDSCNGAPCSLLRHCLYSLHHCPGGTWASRAMHGLSLGPGCHSDISPAPSVYETQAFSCAATSGTRITPHRAHQKMLKILLCATASLHLCPSCWEGAPLPLGQVGWVSASTTSYGFRSREP